MWPWQRRIVWGGIAATLCVAAVVWLALWYFIPSPPSTITIAAGIKNGAFDHIAEQYRERLVLHQVALNVRFTEGMIENVRVINDPKSGVVAAFLFAGVSDRTRSPDLVSLGRINYAPFWIFYKGSETLDRLTQLKGKRVSVPPGILQLANLILNAHGVTADNTIMLRETAPVGANSLKEGKVDVTINPPLDIGAPVTQGLLRDPSVRLMNLAQAEAIARLFPFLQKVVLPQGVVDLERNIPASDVNLIASTDVVVVRKDLHSEIKLLLAQVASEVHSSAGIFQRAGEFPTQTDPEFPVAEEAVDFYRNGPSFLHRYLPFWMVSYAKRMAAILVTAIAIVVPLFNFAPRIYDWFLQSYVNRLFRQLRAVEIELEAELTTPQINALQTDLESINRASRIVPLRRSDLFFALRLHIKQAHADLTRRVSEIGR